MPISAFSIVQMNLKIKVFDDRSDDFVDERFL